MNQQSCKDWYIDVKLMFLIDTILANADFLSARAWDTGNTGNTVCGQL